MPRATRLIKITIRFIPKSNHSRYKYHPAETPKARETTNATPRSNRLFKRLKAMTKHNAPIATAIIPGLSIVKISKAIKHNRPNLYKYTFPTN